MEDFDQSIFMGQATEGSGSKTEEQEYAIKKNIFMPRQIRSIAKYV